MNFMKRNKRIKMPSNFHYCPFDNECKDEELMNEECCYYFDTYSKNDLRANRLWYNLRKFALEHRVINVSDYTSYAYIFYDYEANELCIRTDGNRAVGAVCFDCVNTAMLASIIFEDELLWYFAKYHDNL